MENTEKNNTDDPSEEESNISNVQTTWFRRKRRSDMPYEDIETEGERQLKKLAKKQMETDISLNSYLNRKKQFTESSLYVPPSAKVSGEYSLKGYQALVDKDKKLDELRSSGLSEEEINFKLVSKISTGTGNYGVDPLVEQKMMENIEMKIKNKTAEVNDSSKTFQGAKKLSRHEMDLEKAITCEREKAKLLGILVTGSQLLSSTDTDDKSAADLKEILQNIEKPVDTSNTSKMETSEGNDESKQIQEKNTTLLIESTGCEECDRLRQMDRYFVGPLLKTEYTYYEECDPCKQIRHRKIDEEREKQRLKKVAEKLKNDLEQKESSLQKQAIAVKPIPVEVIEKYRLTVDQIKEIPKFSNYTPGVPSKVLYLKNLSSKATVEDLKALFNRFNETNEKQIEIKLLTGRMRGQAFVHFFDENKAQTAMELINGYDFKGKPIVIQFGKKG